MAATAIAFDRYSQLQDDDCEARIVSAKKKLGDRAVILGHHYQRADVYKHADLTGDSLRLSKLSGNTDAQFVVFCGVHFMAEVADILGKPGQVVVLPDMAAGCSMADMASLPKVERAWRELSEVLDPDQAITPVTYINSAADLKAFCGDHGGIVCTSSNAGRTSASCSTTHSSQRSCTRAQPSGSRPLRPNSRDCFISGARPWAGGWRRPVVGRRRRLQTS